MCVLLFPRLLTHQEQVVFQILCFHLETMDFLCFKLTAEELHLRLIAVWLDLKRIFHFLFTHRYLKILQWLAISQSFQPFLEAVHSSLNCEIMHLTQTNEHYWERAYTLDRILQYPEEKISLYVDACLPWITPILLLRLNISGAI